MNKLRRVLLVDDYEADNFLHRMLFEELDVAEEIQVRLNGAQAISYLTTKVDGEYPCPELICLDVNMPVMNGWEFLDAYELLDDAAKGGVVVVMLTTSLNPADAEAARKRKFLSDFINKPLTQESLVQLLEHFFPGRF